MRNIVSGSAVDERRLCPARTAGRCATFALAAMLLVAAACPAFAHAPNQPPHQSYKIGDLTLESGETIVDSARNCALATRELLDRQSLRAPPGKDGALEVALTDAPDIFLRVARGALQLQIGDVQLREVLHPARAS